MELLRKFLIFLRKEYKEDGRRIFFRSSILVIVTSLTAIAVDALLPFDGYWNILRSALVGATAIPLFALFYLISLYLHFEKVAEGDGWVPFRARFSTAWRLRIFAILCAILFVVALNLSQNAVYTLTSGLLGAVLIAGIAFIRYSSSEAARDALGIPDARDVISLSHKDNFFKDRETKREEKAAEKESRKTAPKRTKKSKSKDE